MSLYKLAKGRCWAGYEPVPGKEPYSDGSCRPAGSKNKKDKNKQKKSANVDPLLQKLKAINFTYTMPKCASCEELQTQNFVKFLGE